MSRPRKERQLRRSRTGLVLVAVISCGVVLVLNAVVPRHITIAAKLVTAEVKLTLATDWQLRDLPASEVKITNAERLSLDGKLSREGQPPGPNVARQEISLRSSRTASSWSSSIAGEDLRVNLAIRAGAEVGLSVAGEKGRTLLLKIAGPGTEGTIDAGAEFQVSGNSCVVEGEGDHNQWSQGDKFKIENASREIRFAGDSRPLAIGIELPPDEGPVYLLVGHSLQIKGIDFQRSSVPISAISGSGSVSFPSLTLKPAPINVGDFLQLRASGALDATSIVFRDGIELELSGHVQDVRVGPAGVIRSVKPSWLQYFATSESIQLLFGAMMAVGGGIAAVIYRLALVPEPPSA